MVIGTTQSLPGVRQVRGQAHRLHAHSQRCQRRPGPGDSPPADLDDLRGVTCVPAACRPSRSLPLVSRSLCVTATQLVQRGPCRKRSPGPRYRYGFCLGDLRGGLRQRPASRLSARSRLAGKAPLACQEELLRLAAAWHGSNPAFGRPWRRTAALHCSRGPASRRVIWLPLAMTGHFGGFGRGLPARRWRRSAGRWQAPARKTASRRTEKSAIASAGASKTSIWTASVEGRMK